MSHWNHRLVREQDGSLRICEVFYGDGEKPDGYSPAEVYHHRDWGGDEMESVREQVEWFLNALSKPILNEEDFF